MTETVAEHAGAGRIEGRSRGVITAYIVLLIVVLTLDVTAWTGNWQGAYSVLLVCTAVAFAILVLCDFSLRTSRDRRRNLASEPVRLRFRGRGAILAFVGAMIIGITGAPYFAHWWESNTDPWGSWLVLAVSTVIAAGSTWDMLGGESAQVKALRSRAEVRRCQIEALRNSNKALVEQARTDPLRTKNRKLREENVALKKQLEGLRQAAEEQGITLSWPPTQQTAPEEAHNPRRRGGS